MTTGIEETLSSKSKWRVCYALAQHSGPIHLRYIASITELHPRAVEQALKSLLRDKVVMRAKSGQRTYFSLNRTHPDWEFLIELFERYQQHTLKQAAEADRERALPALRFAAGSKRFWDKALVDERTS